MCIDKIKLAKHVQCSTFLIPVSQLADSHGDTNIREENFGEYDLLGE